MRPAATALLGIFSSSFVVALSGALMPGPVLTLTVSEASRRGFRAGPLLIAGHAALEAALLALLLAGLGPLLRRESVLGVIGLAGAGILAWMAAGNLRMLPRLTLASDPRAGAAPPGRSPVLAGALVSLSNPYWLLWWATIGVAYLNLSLKHGAGGPVVFYAGHILADLLWYSLIAFGIARGRRYMSDRAYRIIVAACSLFLVGLAAWFGWRGLAGLLA